MREIIGRPVTHENMAIKANFTKDDVARRFDRFLHVVENQEIKRLQKIGEKCVSHARLVPPEQGFTDRTGNLRSSIGYVVFKDGKALHDNYKEVTGPEGGNKSEAIGKSKALAEKVARRHPNGICMVVTAGMNYAVCVEARGRDVITSAEIMATQELPNEVQELVKNITKLFK